MMAFVLSDLGELLGRPCPVWPCVVAVALISAIGGGIIGYFVARKAKETR